MYVLAIRLMLPTAVHVYIYIQLERNEEFYQPLPGTELFYPRRLVYPQEEVGVELSLEQLRASLPQYRRAESPSLKEEEGDSMEMTVAYTSHITMHVPLSKMSATGRVKEEEEEEEEEEGAPLGDGVLPPAVSIADKENIMDSENSPPKKESTGVVSKSKRAPLSLITDPTDELEKLNSEKRAVMAARVDVPSRLPALEGDALMQREMEQLALEKPSRKALGEQTSCLFYSIIMSRSNVIKTKRLTVVHSFQTFSFIYSTFQ